MADQTALPKYVAIAEMLIREIASGRLTDGERLPPERDMAEDLGISVGTLRKSLEDLSQKGLLDRRQGSGNYVKAGREAAGVYALFRLELRSGGGLPTAEVWSVDRMAKPSDLPDFGRSDEGHRIRRLRRLSGRPAALEEIWLDGARAETVRAEDLSESLYLFYRKHLGLWIARAEDRVGVAEVPGWTRPDFPLPPGTPAGYVERLSRDADGETVEYSRTWYDPAHVAYVARLK